MVAMPERCWTVLSAERSAVSMARALPLSRIRSLPAGTCAPSSARISISIAGSSARKNAAAIGSPATTIASRLSITPEKRASAGITLSLVTSCPPPGRPRPRSSSSVARTKAERSKPGREKEGIPSVSPGFTGCAIVFSRKGAKARRGSYARRSRLQFQTDAAQASYGGPRRLCRKLEFLAPLRLCVRTNQCTKRATTSR